MSIRFGDAPYLIPVDESTTSSSSCPSPIDFQDAFDISEEEEQQRRPRYEYDLSRCETGGRLDFLERMFCGWMNCSLGFANRASDSSTTNILPSSVTTRKYNDMLASSRQYIQPQPSARSFDEDEPRLVLPPPIRRVPLPRERPSSRVPSIGDNRVSPISDSMMSRKIDDTPSRELLFLSCRPTRRQMIRRLRR